MTPAEMSHSQNFWPVRMCRDTGIATQNRVYLARFSNRAKTKSRKDAHGGFGHVPGICPKNRNFSTYSHNVFVARTYALPRGRPKGVRVLLKGLRAGASGAKPTTS